MTDHKHYHPLIILFEIVSMIKGSIIFIIYLFVINFNSDSTFIKYGKWALIVSLLISVFYYIVFWFSSTYKLDETSFHIHKGVFTKSKQTIPYTKVQNVNRHRTILHKIFKVTSLKFETAMSGSESAVEFKVISLAEAEKLEQFIKSFKENKNDLVTNEETVVENEQIINRKTIHFTPTKKDIVKASFTSLSFLVLIPVLGTIYNYANDIFNIEDDAKGLFLQFITSVWVIAIVGTIFIIIAVVVGMIYTFIKYGKYEISSDDERIYITKGYIEETAFAISKPKVQAIEVKQTIMKRLLGLAEVKLISAGNATLDSENLQVNTLYPFLPVKRAYEMVSEILPSYEVTETMNLLPKKALWLRILAPSWIWIIVTGLLAYFQPEVFHIETAWIILSVLLLIFVTIYRYLEYKHTRYVLNGQFIQFKSGYFTTTLFLSKREKIIEAAVVRNVLQKKLGLSSIQTVNRGKPVHHAQIKDIPFDEAVSFYRWYLERGKEVEIK